MIEVEARGGGVDTAPLAARLVWACERLGVSRASVGLMVVGPDEMARINGMRVVGPNCCGRGRMTW